MFASETSHYYFNHKRLDPTWEYKQKHIIAYIRLINYGRSMRNININMTSISAIFKRMWNLLYLLQI